MNPMFSKMRYNRINETSVISMGVTAGGMVS